VLAGESGQAPPMRLCRDRTETVLIATLAMLNLAMTAAVVLLIRTAAQS
jgi:hypothetical protein